MKALLKRLCAPMFYMELAELKSVQHSFDKSNERLVTLDYDLEQERRARASLEITNASLQHENEFLRTQFEQAIKNERYALRFMANIQTQSTYGVKPFEDTAGLPENVSLPESSNEPVRVQGIDMVNHARQEFVAELRRREANGESIPIHPDILEAAALAL